MGTIQIKHLRFAYPNQATPLFDDANLQIDDSWHLGMIGRNGRGKTTLMKILLGKLAYQGDIQTNLQFNYFPVAIGSDQPTTTQQLMADDIIDYSTQWQLDRELTLLGVDPAILEQPFPTLSPGVQVKVQLASLFMDHEHFQLIDEPTNHLDTNGRQAVAIYLQQKTGFLVISHDRAFLNQVIDHVISLNRAQITVQTGNYDTWQTTKQQQDQTAVQHNQQIGHEINRLQQAATKRQAWADSAERGKFAQRFQDQHANLDRGFLSHQAAKSMKRATQLVKRTNQQVQTKQALLADVEIAEPLTMTPLVNPSHTPLITGQQITLQRAGQQFTTPFDFQLSAGERLVIGGPNGSGKSTLMQAILGQADYLQTGTLRLKPNLKLATLAQTFENIHGSIHELADAQQASYQTVLANLRKLGFERDLFDFPVENFSLGQKRKVMLACGLSQTANIYLWDEPLNYLDVITRAQVQTMVLATKPTMILIDHDQQFVDAVATKRLQLNDD